LLITQNPPKKKKKHKKKKTMFWGLLGSRHVQTSLENIVLRSRLELKIAFTSRQLQQHYVFCYAVGLCGWVSVLMPDASS
jgi:hypothetical protein